MMSQSSMSIETLKFTCLRAIGLITIIRIGGGYGDKALNCFGLGFGKRG